MNLINILNLHYNVIGVLLAEQFCEYFIIKDLYI